MSTIDIPRTRASYNRLLQGSFSFFLRHVFHYLNPADELLWNWHIDAMCYALDRVRRGEDRRLVITVPPRHLKTITVSVAYVAWAMGHDPTVKFICASYGADLSARFGGLVRRVITSDWFASAFPQLKISKATDGDLRTTLGGYRAATSVGGAVTGIGASCIIVDDLNKTGDARSPAALQEALEFYRGSLLQRLNDQNNGSVILIAQRLHEADVPGFCIESGAFRHLNLPAVAQVDEKIAIGPGKYHERRVGELLFPEFQSEETLAGMRSLMGIQHYSAQYLQDPTPRDGGYIAWSDIGRYEGPLPDPRDAEKIVQSWDTAEADEAENDYNVGTTWGFFRGRWLLLDLRRFKGVLTEQLAEIRAQRDKYRPDVIIIEKAAGGRHLLELLTHERRTMSGSPYWRLYASTPAHSKRDRWSAGAAALSDGFAVFPSQADWLETLRAEITGFPRARHDDQVDSISQFLNYAIRSRTGVTLRREALEAAATAEQKTIAARQIYRDFQLDDVSYWLRHLR